MAIARNSDTQLWDICSQMAQDHCCMAKKHNFNINNTIYAFRFLHPYNLIDIEDWDDVLDFITVAIYNLSLYYISKNLPTLIKSKYISK